MVPPLLMILSLPRVYCQDDVRLILALVVDFVLVLIGQMQKYRKKLLRGQIRKQFIYVFKISSSFLINVIFNQFLYLPDVIDSHLITEKGSVFCDLSGFPRKNKLLIMLSICITLLHACFLFLKPSLHHFLFFKVIRIYIDINIKHKILSVLVVLYIFIRLSNFLLSLADYGLRQFYVRI